MQPKITSHCRIQNNQIILNGELVFEALNDNFTDFSKQAYQHFKLNYLKFFKMDNLSKLAFVNCELLLRNVNLKEKYKPEDIAVFICNSASSLDTDRKHSESISDRKNYFPSPSVFVYTLPNILVGEICIRNNFKGENSFFVFDTFESEFITAQVNQLLNDNKCKACVMGWVDFENEHADTLLCLIEKSEDENLLELTTENYRKLYFENGKLE